ncbi:acylphosphatase-2 isoform X3 [Ictalurus punctatus]|uniref:Acylphosphatase n=1 Tax=Ictalurus punctatus TaxID=7998 RepID=A0A979F1L1_ICTPU|nr:acylphosphatase-2 isoform X3 [Ictalurus punctatus]
MFGYGLNVFWLLTHFILFPLSQFAMSSKYASVDFEIFGNVQGVCFRMYTEDQAKKLGVNGWVKNTRQGTVIGQVQGPPEKVSEIVIAQQGAHPRTLSHHPAHQQLNTDSTHSNPTVS